MIYYLSSLIYDLIHLRLDGLFSAKDFPGIVIAEEQEWRNCVEGSTAVVNLAGLPISTRWSPEVSFFFHVRPLNFDACSFLHGYLCLLCRSRKRLRTAESVSPLKLVITVFYDLTVAPKASHID